MSYAQRFMQNKAPSTDSEGWQTVGRAEHGGGSRVAEHGGMRRWTEDKSQFPSAFSKPRRDEERPAYQKQWMSAAPPAPKPISLDSAEDFPTLGGKPKAAKAPVQTGWASKAASWAASDAADAAEQRRLEEAEAAVEKERMKAAAIPDLFSRIRQTSDRLRGEFQEPDYEGDYTPHSPPYDPDYEEEESGPANPHLDYKEEKDWIETGR